MFERFKKRSYTLERLDTGDYTPAEYARWQREMWFIHRVFGEFRAIKKALGSEIGEHGEDRISVLDVGAGSGELLRRVRRLAVNRDTRLVGTDLSADAAAILNSTGIVALRCDGIHLPFADDSFDYVICSLFLHHLSDQEAVKMLGEMKRVARIKIVVIDLHRNPIAYYFYMVTGWFFLQRFTREDGSLSILRSLKPDEMRQLAAKAGLSDFSVYRSAAYRLVLTGK